MLKSLYIPCLVLLTMSLTYAQQQPLKIGLARLTHGHVHWAFQSAKTGVVEIVGIAEPDREVAERYARQYGVSMDIVYPTIEEMIKARKPSAVAAFGSIYEHLETVRKCAPAGIHVMVEKPLAIDVEHATEMASLARQHNILLVTNYETTWYPTNHLAYQWMKEGKIGRLSKLVVHDGHEGPREINVQPEFLSWLTDPEQNGGGAIVDFGCYGANLATWMMNEQEPSSVTAITQQLKPEIYPEVDDEATIVLTYPHTQVIIQASWNWPFGRKDMEVYGQTGFIISKNKTQIDMRFKGDKEVSHHTTVSRPAPYDDPFKFFSALVNKEITLSENDLGGLANNLIVVKILDAARESARTGKTVHINSSR